MFTIAVKFVLVALAILFAPDRCHGWDQAELDLFDLVEEVGENFYDILHVEQVRIFNYSSPPIVDARLMPVPVADVWAGIGLCK